MEMNTSSTLNFANLDFHYGNNSSKSQNSLLQDILEHLTTVIHVLSVGLTIYVLYLCFITPFSLVTWHVLLYTVGWSLLMTEGILAVIRENVFTKRLKQPMKLRVHWITLILAILLIIGGLALIIWNRARGDGRHFSTEHGLSGIIATIFAFVTAINGFPVLYSVKLRDYLSPNINKLIHGFLGFATIVSGAYGTITGYYTGWFQNRASETMFIVCFVISVVITVWLVLRPVINGVTRLRNLCNR